MVDRSSVHPNSLIRCRWLLVIALVPVLFNLPGVQVELPSLSAVEIPGNLLIGPSLAVYEKPYLALRTASFIEIPADQILESVPLRESAGKSAETVESNFAFFLEFLIDEQIRWQPQTDSVVTEPESEILEEKKIRPEDRYDGIISEAANQHDVDPAIIKAIIMAESNYNPKAVSRKGARGLMQLMPRTAESLGVDDIFCPRQNILAGVKYFKQLLNQFNGNVKLALAAYNAGSRKVKKYRGIPPFKTTKLYIKKVIEYHKYYSQEIVESG